MYRFHVLGVPHTASNEHHCSCAYTQKVVRLCAMLKSAGHHVIHYGNELSAVVCDEHVTVTLKEDLDKQYGDRWMEDQYSFAVDDPVYKKFFNITIGEVEKRKQKHDFLLCMWGAGHKPVADAHSDMIVVEPGIGYPGGQFARWKVWESYAIMHAYFGMEAVGRADKMDWYNVVIPNFFDPSHFDYRKKKDDYLLFLGRVGTGKGINVVIDIARATGKRLKIAGPGKFQDIVPYLQIGDKVEWEGFANVEKRRELMSHAEALVCPTMYSEPFGGVAIEAMLSGTPVISTDWGAFTETVLHGLTGYRCRTFEHFTEAVNNIDSIDHQVCRNWALHNYSMANVNVMYEEYWRMVMNVYRGGGWAPPYNEGDTNLNWLMKRYPRVVEHKQPKPGRPKLALVPPDNSVKVSIVK